MRGHRTAARSLDARELWQRDDGLSYLVGAVVWLMMIVMVIPGGFNYDTVNRSGDPVSRIGWLIIIGCSAVILIWRASLVWLVLRKCNPFLLSFVVLAALSVAWSINPPNTVKQLIRLLTIFAASVAFVATGWHVRRYQNVLRPVITLLLAGSILFGLMFPLLAIHQSDSPELHNAWHGLATQKNILGELACLGVMLWFHGWLNGEVAGWRAFAGLGTAVACLVLSKSQTSMMASAFAVAFLSLLHASAGLRRYMPYLVIVFVAFLLIYAVAILRLVPGLDALLGPISAITGKDLTFSNRSTIWEIMVQNVQLHPLLGSGYGAYWIGPDMASPSYIFVEQMHFYPNSAHNGYLDVINELGAAGLCLLGAYLIHAVWQSLSLLPVERGQAALYLALFLQQAITNLSESRWLSVSSVDFVVVTLATAALGRAHLEHCFRHFYGQPFARPAADVREPDPDPCPPTLPLQRVQDIGP